MSDDDVLSKVVFLLIIIFKHVAAGDGQNCSVSREGEGRDGRGEPVELTQPLLVVPVPDVHEPVAPARRECVVLSVERNGVNRVNVFYTILF